MLSHRIGPAIDHHRIVSRLADDGKKDRGPAAPERRIAMPQPGPTITCLKCLHLAAERGYLDREFVVSNSGQGHAVSISI